MKKTIAAFLSLILIVSLFTGCTKAEPTPTDTTPGTSEPTGEQEKIVVGISTDAGFAARGVEVSGLYKKANESNGRVEIIEQNADNDSTKQIQQIKSMVDQGVDAIVVCAIDMNAIQSALDYADSKDTIVMLYDRWVDHPAVQFAGLYDSLSDGTLCGEQIAKFDDGEDHVVFEMVGNRADTNAIARSEGFHSVIDGYANLKVVQIETNWNVEEALSGLQNALQKYPDVWAIYDASGHMDGAIETALKEINRWNKVGEEDHVIVVSLGGEPPAPELCKQGYVDVHCVIRWDLMGEAIYDAIITIMEGGTPDTVKHYVDTVPFTPEEIAAQTDLYVFTAFN